MANDLSDTVRDALTQVVRSMSDTAPSPKDVGSGMGGMKGLAAGAGLMAAAPLAKKGLDAVRGGGGLPTPNPKRAVSKVASKTGDKIAGSVKDTVSSKVDEAGGAGGLVKEAASGLLPSLGGDSDGGKEGMPGVGKGRRMPVQQNVDVAVELETAYNQWTQFEEWPNFMHRVTRVTQEEDNKVSFATKIWGKTKEFQAEIVTQRPDDRIMWKVSQGITHTGVVSFHELAPRLTRIELSLDVDPGSLIEKAARGMRHVKRAARADLHRFKAYIEMQEIETGAWRGVIEDGEVVEEHDDSYDEERDYSDPDDLYEQFGSEDEGDDEEEQDEDQDQEEQEDSRERSRTAAASQSSSSRSPSSGSRSRSRGSDSDSKSSSRRRSRGDSNGSSKSSGSSKSGGSSASSRSSSSRSKSGSAKPSAKSSKSSSSSNGKAKARSSKSSSGSGSRRKASSRS